MFWGEDKIVEIRHTVDNSGFALVFYVDEP